MTDETLTEDQERHLSELLHRAAQGLVVEVPDRSRPNQSEGTRHSQTRWAVAAALLAIGALGGAWLSTGGTNGTRIEAGPADDGADTEVLRAGGGVWRLPEETADLELLGAAAIPQMFGLQMAVDDPSDPQRWFAVVPASYGFDGRIVEIDGLRAGITATVVDEAAATLTGSTWIELVDELHGGNLTIAARGVPREELLAFARDTVERIGRLSSNERVKAALRELPVPTGLTPAWDPTQVGFPDPESDEIHGLALFMSDPTDGRPLVVQIGNAGIAPAVTSLGHRLQLEGAALSEGESPEARAAITMWPDLGPGGMVVETGGVETAFVADPSGVQVSVTAFDPGPGRATGQTAGRPSPSLVTQLRIIASLRPTSEERFRTALEEQGLDLVEPGEQLYPDMITTTVPGP